MYGKQAIKLKRILLNNKPVSHFKKDVDYQILKKTVQNRKQILSIIEINDLNKEDKYNCMLKIQNEILTNNNETSNSFKDLIIPKKYIRMNTLIAESGTETKKISEIETLNKTQQEMLKNYQLKTTEFPFIYELPLNRAIKLSTQRFYIIQNLPTALPPLVLNPPKNVTVIDSCAAPGNKTSHLSAIMRNTGKITAFELNRDRYEHLKENLKACHVTNTVCLNEDFCETKLEAEYILVDPSCSGSGIHQNYIKNTKRIESLSNFQVIILSKALKMKSAKRVVYSTCSVHEEENEEVVQRVSENFKEDWNIEKIETKLGNQGSEKYEFSNRVVRFDRGETIGFFCALFVRKI